MMVRLVCSLVALVLLLAGAGRVGAALINVSTGLDPSGNVIPTGGVTDAHWTVTPGTTSPSGTAQTVFPNNADWFGGWLSNDSNSDWIARNANVADNGPAPYTFTTTFVLTGLDLSTASLSGSWAIDDAGTLALNGHTLGTLGSGAWGALTPFTAPQADFVQGVNTLTITITSDDQFLEGVRLQGVVTASASPLATSSVPEPSTLALLVLGGALAGWRRWRAGRGRQRPTA